MKKSAIHTIQNWITIASDFVSNDIWRLRLEDLPFGQSFAVKQLRTLLLTLRGFDEDKCFARFEFANIFVYGKGAANGLEKEVVVNRVRFNIFRNAMVMHELTHT